MHNVAVGRDGIVVFNKMKKLRRKRIDKKIKLSGGARIECEINPERRIKICSRSKYLLI